MQVNINAGDITKCDVNWKAGRFIRVHHCILFLMEGEAHYISDNEDVILQLGHLYITPINKLYEVTQTPDKLMKQLWLHIDGIYCLPNRLIDMDTTTEDNVVIQNIIQTIVAMMIKKTEFSIIERQLEVMFALIPSEKEADMRIKATMHYIAENYHKKLTNQNIAQFLSMDVDYLSRLFKLKVGITLHKYIEKYRIEKACMLIMSDQKTGDIAQKVGYQDAKSFMRAFKRNKGIVVTEYKKSRFLQL